ncbi:hypothetical protein BH10PSE14_BH10PSE14_06190 [soil metagenome]
MTDRPAIFAAPMIRALRADRKTQTRRLATSPLRKCAVGDRLFVREGWRVGYGYDWHREDLGRAPKPSEYDPATTPIEYLADDTHELGGRSWPSIHMPRWASRLTLIVEGVKVEPLQAISRADAIAEGLSLASNAIEEFWRWPEPFHENLWLSPPAAYRHLWSQLHTDEGQRWEDNPDVVALTFRVVASNIDQVAA